jgi:hypothetical protein
MRFQYAEAILLQVSDLAGGVYHGAIEQLLWQTTISVTPQQ